MIKTIVFDIGGVLLDWDPRYFYRDIFKTEEEMEFFLGNICTRDWNHTLDLGRSWEDAALELVTKYPAYKEHIYMYWDRWLDMFSGPIHETVDILMDVKKRGYQVLALSNWNDEKFEVALREFPFLRLFDGRIVSGEVKLAKPDPEIYKLLLSTFSLNPRETFFMDDVMTNVEAAREQGIQAVQFTSPKALEDALTSYGVYPELDEQDEEGAQSCCGGGCSCHSR